ncbi:hypothetical protein KU74_12275 [Pectobacterium brasiliense]|uniref:Uncharacterized protein n=1 Tax=Pectobacterium brasiliense TaxID=180957 RepID=A0A0M2F3N2_9GAMM|nr:hypothetical protein [Pectobacterium brasiliense]KGA34245.1 hypothetical protein KU74_12275 [Pectobacterium brasiliense]
MDDIIRGLINGVFDCYQSWSKDKQKQALDSLSALSDLLVENKIYLRDYSYKKIIDKVKEAELAKEWKRVGILFETSSPELAMICKYKSDYWIHRELYTERKVTELGITIRNIEEQLSRAQRNLL